MSFDECYQLGNVVKTHGLRGEIVFFLDVDDPKLYQEMESVFVDLNGKLVPFFIESFHLQGDRAIVALDEMQDIDSAKELVGKDLYLPLSFLPDLSEGQYYFHELPGLEVYHNNKLIGIAKEVYQMPNNNLLAVDHDNTEVLIPLNDHIVYKVDLVEKKILTNLPDGLLEVFTEDKP